MLKAQLNIKRGIFVLLWLFCFVPGQAWSQDFTIQITSPPSENPHKFQGAEKSLNPLESPGQSADSASLKVVYPRPGNSIEAKSTFIVGATAPGNVLTCNGENVRLNGSGFFAHVVPLHYGANHFELVCSCMSAQNNTSDANTISKEITINRKAPAEPIGPDEFKLTSLKPAADMGVKAGDIIYFSAHATPDATVSVQLGEHWLKLAQQSGKSHSSDEQSPDVAYGKVIPRWDTNLLSDVYKGSYQVSDGDHFYAIHPKFVLICGDKRITSVNKNTISTVEEIAVAQTLKTPTVVRLGPGLARTTPLVEGVRVFIDGWSGDNMRCLYCANHHVWIKREDLAIENTDNKSNSLLDVSVLHKNIKTATAPHAVAQTINIISDDYGEQICLPLSEKLPYQIEQKLSPNCLLLRVYGVSPDTDWITSEPNTANQDKSSIDHVSWRQVEDNVYEVTVHLLGTKQWGYKIFYSDNALCLDVKHPVRVSTDIDKNLSGIKICLDPGHGGPDIGATGCSGVTESQINLDVATKVKSYLESAGATVIMTRESESEHPSLDERVKIATDAQADFLISIHNNALPDGLDPWQQHGTSSYWYHPQSLALARYLKNAVKEASGFTDLGARYQNLAIARAQAMPAVLLELGFMINPDEFANLIDSQGQSKIAQAISNGVKQYINSGQ